MRPLLIAVLVAAASAVSAAETLLLAPQEIPQWKAVYGRVEARDLVPARARIGGTVVELSVSEGDSVAAGTQIALVRDDKISFQIAAIDAQLRALGAQLERAQAELTRGRSLVERGVSTAQRLEQLETDVSVTQNQIAAAQAQRDVALQQAEEGEVLAPVDGRVLTVPVTRDAVIMGGEPVATIAGGGFFLRLAIPERHAPDLREGAELQITSNGAVMPGRLAKLYPQIENGRVIADVEVEGLDASFVDARVLVRVPVGVRRALLVPQAALSSHSGLDFVRIRQGDAEVERAVVPGEVLERDGAALVEILTGLHAGDTVLLP
ncbi:MAG TPA: efflux RND transporter periplasmic adaptor subunit [Paracoccus solventivorans]|uniref:efflux RND transporter periplasmic adaptor subunit n=1 Tax=Paracoccus solventivorans TaxID=53463 RepID=UPI002D01ABCF|nr:efflux RND transporter periplasmic adaptor subunit [Paracoccus solventivorans]HMM08214.1 efflux RND transporter periplasmic adaptor subunit [Paracoccus solventivorans]